MLPKGAIKTVAAPAFSAGSLVMYENDGAPILAVVLAWKKNRYNVLNDRGREIELVTERLHALPGKMPGNLTSHAEQTEYLLKLRRAAETEASSVVLDDLWSVLQETPQEVSTTELTTLYFNDDSLDHHLAMRFALLADKLYFKRRQEDFSARAPEVIAELKKAEETRLERQRIIEGTFEFIRARVSNPSLPIPQEAASAICLLEDVVVNTSEIDPAHQKEAKDLIERAAAAIGISFNGPIEQKAYLILEKIHHFTAATNLSFVRYRPPLTFSAEALAQTEAITQPAAFVDLSAEEQKLRLDLTHLNTFTIDDITTLDSDDGVSIEAYAGGYHIGVHISDVARAIASNSPLDLETQERATSIYLPEGSFHMFPKALAEDRLSLSLGSVRPCVSCMIDVSRDFKILSTRIVATLVRISHRFTYTQVDQILHDGYGKENDPLIETLYNFTVEKETERHQNGGMRINKREVQVMTDPDGSLRLVEIEENSPARALIAELAVLANSAFAEFAVANGLALVFRGQEHPEEENQQRILAIPEGPARDYAIRSKLKRSTTDVSAHPHATLGLRAYAQITSPIRRYLDLVNQRQILNFLQHGKPFYSAAELQTLIDAVGQPLAIANSITKETKRFWILKYLEHLYKERLPVSGTVTRNDLKNPMVELDAVFTPFPVRTERVPALGSHIKIRIAAVDALWDYIKLEEVKE